MSEKVKNVKPSCPQMPHQIILQDRRVLELTGVADVEAFDDTAILAQTSMGDLHIKGDELHIRHLDLESGSLSVEGHIDQLIYEETQRGGLFHRLLR